MTIEQEIFINILSDHLNRKKTILSSECVDWSIILYYAKIQQVEGIVYYQCKSILPDEFKNQLQIRYYASIDAYAKREYFVNKLFGLLRAENIDCFIVKGLPVASFYPLSPLRTMSDADLVVHSQDRRSVHKLLLKLGYVNDSCNEKREWVYHKDIYSLELHDRLIYSESINRKSHEEFFVDVWDYVHNSLLDWNFHFLFLILHLRKHLMNCGVGFRQFMDVAVVAKNNSKLNWIWIEEQLVKLGLIDFTRIVFALNESWFGVKTPILSKSLDQSFFELATEQVFNNGVFGFDNEDNKNNLAVNNARRGKNAKASMAASAVHKVFPRYAEMVSVKKYSFIKGKKWLLPLAWIYRIFNGSDRKRFSEKMNDMKSTFVSKETIEKREKYLKQWGLNEVD